ncbi:MAG: sensor domain-containing phosphodiesterase [Acidimicrobiales bacterium]
MAVALVPLLGLGSLAAADVADAKTQVDRTLQIAEITPHLDQAIQTEVLVDVESYWAHALAAIHQLGLSPAVLIEITGLDVELEYLRAQERVDDALSKIQLSKSDLEKIERARAAVRPGADNNVIETAYDEVESVAAAAIDSDIREIERLVGGVRNADELTNAVDVLVLSTKLRESVSKMTEAYFGARFEMRGAPSSKEVIVLLQHRLTFRSNLASLKLIIPEGSDLKPLWSEVDSDPRVVAFFTRVDELTAGIALAGSADSRMVTGIPADDLSGEVTAFLESLDAVSRHVDFVEASLIDVLDRSAAVHSRAQESRNRTLAFTLGLGLAALIAVVAASLWIVRPLRQMAAVVAELRDGHFGDSVREAGPAEVRDAARALNEAVESMSVAEKMATALAERDLDSPAFDVATTGRLGSSLREAVSALATSIAEREEFRERLAHEASHDGLTGVANRSETMTHLGQALGRFHRSDRQLALFFIDVDGFKSVNDTHGHLVGDEVLRTIAKRTRDATRLGDHVGRIGGDEFVVIAEPIADLAAAIELADRVLETISQPLTSNEVSFEISASIGVAFATPDSTPEGLLRDADLALYEAKAEGRCRVSFCDDDLKARQQSFVTIEQELRQAIRNDELELHFQPIVDSLSGVVSSVEALLRWPQPTGKFLPPGIFIPVAERSDLILAVDRWVLHSIAEQLSDWDDDPTVGSLTASVNISARHLSVPSLVEEVLGPLRSWNVDPARLTIEITETALLDDLDQAAATLTTLRSAGLRIAIDDFGTGYASLAHLRRLPIDILKIDQTFVAGLAEMDDRSLVQLTIDTGHLLGASIVAEGVETESQARQLTEMGTDLLQGFGLGMPMAEEDLRAWILQQTQSVTAA